MSGIGESLRQARTSLGLDLEQASNATNIRARYLDDLEAERFDRLPEPVYARSFLLEYADFLGLDGQLLLAWYDQRQRGLVRPEIVARSTIRRSRRTFPGRGVVAVAAIALAGLALWAFGRSSETARPPTLTHRASLVPPAAERAPAAPVTHRPARVAILTAARGDCWLSVRIGSRDGEVVREGILGEGETVRLGLQRTLWVRLGAPWNVDLRVAGRRVRAPDGAHPVNVLLSRAGLTPA